MKLPDVVLLAVPLVYLLAAVGLFPLDARPIDAVLVGSVAAAAVIGQALFITPPGGW